ncbi:alpha/beta fold hydrolase [Nonomuraea recticatena]|uniref:Alpha/beta hydrolase n=1 Tax=Nonomuraea recticatena TaxID=46178 RepID=A0ABN3SY87_9ACTN
MRTRHGISYLDEGNGPVALFVHGAGTGSGLWANVIAALREERRCVALDLPVHGQSEVREDLSLPALAEVIEEFCADLGLDRVDLVANDSGGAIAQVFAVRHPERLRTLTLTNCDVHDNLPPEPFRPTVELAAQGGLAPLTATLLDRPSLLVQGAFAASYERIDDPEGLVERFVRPIFGDPERGRAFERFLVGLRAEHLVAIERELAELAVPTLVVWGTGDPFFELHWAGWLRDTIPGVRKVVEIEGGRLFFVDERAGELVPHLREHFASGLAASATGGGGRP